MDGIQPGELVIVRGAPERGAFRVERLLTVGDAAHARLLSYGDGGFSVVPLTDVAPCPPGTPAAGRARRSATAPSSA